MATRDRTTEAWTAVEEAAEVVSTWRQSISRSPEPSLPTVAAAATACPARVVAEAAGVLMDRGATDVYVACTHGVFSGHALEKLDAAPIVELGVTNTIRIMPRPPFRKIRVLSVAELLGEAIRRIHDSESVSSLFA